VYTVLNAHKNLNSGVSPALREKILQAIEETGYIANNAAQSLVSGRTYNIGLVEVNNWLTEDMILAFEKFDFMVMPMHHNSDPVCERRCLKRLISRGVDCIIISRSSYPDNNDLLEQIMASGIALIILGEEKEGVGSSMHIMLNEKRGMMLPIEFFHKAGKRRFAIVDSLNNLRLKCIHETLERFPDCQLMDEFYFSNHKNLQEKVNRWRTQYIHEALEHFPDCQLMDEFYFSNHKNLLEKVNSWRNDPKLRPEVIVTTGDGICWLIIEALREVQLRVPEDIQLTGIGNNPSFYHLIPLTTVMYSPKVIADACVSMFLDWLAHIPYKMRVIEPRLIVRKSAPG